ncbi:MAG TPA: serine/threonine-protein kinase [Kofleriaceae bacterium]|nr:serine/threonine-protein kinase [Kofleriaceae bacterium]
MAKQDLTGAVLDKRYRLTERLAEGAMGIVYRGVNLTVDRPVAIKMMHASLPGEMAARERFQREAKLMALVDHPHCVSVIDYGLFDRKPYLVMELVRGRSLHEVLAEQRRVDVSRATDIIRQVLSGLAYAHDQGIIHRDIKPANIMLTPKAPLGVHVRILDFGLARLHLGSTSLTDGLAVGTPSYMAPEQCRGDAVDARVDLYACGVVLFEMLTGRKPFVADDPMEIVKQQLQAAPPRLADVAEGDFGKLEEVVARALAKLPADRFASAIAMSDAIDGASVGRVTGPEATAAFPPEQIGSDALVPIDSSVSIPITIGSSVGLAPPRRSGEPTRLSRLLPVSRMRYVVLGGLLVVAAGIYGLVWLASGSTNEAAPVAALRDATLVNAPAPTPAPVVVDPTAATLAAADELVTAGKLEAALDVIAKARRDHADQAALPFAAGKIYFAKMWWADGIKSFRDAIRIDPHYRADPELIKIVIRGFSMTPSYDDRLGAFLAELGAAAQPALDETARTHPNPQVRARAAAQLRRNNH